MLVGRGSRIARKASQRDVVFASKIRGIGPVRAPSRSHRAATSKRNEAAERPDTARQSLGTGSHRFWWAPSLREPFADDPEPRPTMVAFLPHL
jgi:hypothetical protein